jgi:5-methylcytosine-specific restriction endonuclease McrA
MNEECCVVCQEKLNLTLMPQTIHYGRLDCPNCGFRGFARNPKSNKIGTTKEKRIGKPFTPEEVCVFHKMKETICFMCLRKINELGYCETLTCDHIQELDKGGEDIIENQQVLCSACHKLKNWVRLYCHWHFLKRGESNGDTNT